MDTAVQRDTMHVVIVGHVDHGKSTLVGRLLADTGVLGDGKLEKVRATCERQGKVFEYAFLLDALEAEQDQGITIDAARVFFRTPKRDYIIIDAPGHIEFLKNMVTGAARAEAAMLLIDAKEGVRENSRRHGYLLAMLGIRQVTVLVNKMDLVGFDRAHFEGIVREYGAFLGEMGVTPGSFIPMSARGGEMVAERGTAMPWYDGPTVLEAVDVFTKRPTRAGLPLRMPVQDVYKWGHRGDDARIIAGRVESGAVKVGDRVMFSPSNKTAMVASIERWAAPVPESADAGRSIGITLDQQLFVDRGEVVSHLEDPPDVGTRLRVNLFWLGKRSMEQNRTYKLKLGTAQTEVKLDQVTRVLDASDLQTYADKPRIDRHDVAEVVLRTRQPIAFDASDKNEVTGRFVIVDGYDIAGVGKHAVARALEGRLVRSGHHAYLLDGKNVFLGVDADLALDNRDELVRRFGEVAHLFLDAGLIVVSTTNVIGLADHRVIETLVAPFPVFVVHIGDAEGPQQDLDLRFEPGVDVDVAVDGILGELGGRARLRSG